MIIRVEVYPFLPLPSRPSPTGSSMWGPLPSSSPHRLRRTCAAAWLRRSAELWPLQPARPQL
eukprot:933945-Pyramimonas_sp.AAC.1